MENDNKVPTIHVGNVRCKIDNVTTSVSNLLSKELAVKAPNYWFSTKFKNGQWDGSVKFFIRPANTFPTGLLSRVLDFCEEIELEVKLDDTRLDVDKYELQSVPDNYTVSDLKESRDYQVNTINKIITKSICGIPFMRGIVNIATNGGKTTIAEAIIKELYPKLIENNTNFLFVTHSKEIAAQAKKSIESDVGIEVGFIGNGKWDVKPVTIAIITTLYSRMKKSEFDELKESTIGFVADECHHSKSTSWYEVFGKLSNALIRIGLTGTVDKTNPINEMKLYSCTGEIINKISNEYLIDAGYSAKPVCILFMVTTPEIEGEAYQDAYELGVVESEERLGLIADICEKEVNSNNTVLILVEHIGHGINIQEELERLQRRVFFTNGTLSSEKRQELLDDLKEHRIDILISTSILDEGVDVSNINAIIYARGMKSTRKLLQGLGRGLRKKSDGSKLRFYDFIDDMNSKLLEHSLSRYNVLKSEGFSLKQLDINNYKEMTWEEIEHE